MNKVFVFVIAVLSIVSCNSTSKGADSAQKAEMMPGNGVSSDDASFFPEPDANGPAYQDHDFSPVYWAFIGRFASYEELVGSPFYELLCQRIPELKMVDKYEVDLARGVEDVWMLIPTVDGVRCRILDIKAEGKDDVPEDEIYYFSEDMKPILLHTSMSGKGSIVIDYSYIEDEVDFGVNATFYGVPKYEPATNELKCVPSDYGEETIWPTVPMSFGGLANGDFLTAEDGSVAIKFMLNGEIFCRVGNGEPMHCFGFSYMSGGKLLIAVKSDDGKHRAVWERNEYDDVYSVEIRQVKGDILPENKVYKLK